MDTAFYKLLPLETIYVILKVQCKILYLKRYKFFTRRGYRYIFPLEVMVHRYGLLHKLLGVEMIYLIECTTLYYYVYLTG